MRLLDCIFTALATQVYYLFLMRRFLLLSAALLSAQLCSAQSGGLWDGANKVSQKGKETVAKKGAALKNWKQHLKDWGTDTSYSREAGVEGRLHSDGWALGIYGARKSSDGKSLWGLHLDFSEVIAEKQVKQQNSSTAYPELGGGPPYVFGKINNLYALSLWLSQDRQLLPGVLEGSVSVGWRWGAGLSMALLKPYYLKLLYLDNSSATPVASAREERYGDGNAALFLTPSRILGAGRWSQGLSELQAVPGLTGEFAITIAPKKANALVPTLALGAAGAFYTQKLPVMAEGPASPWQLRLFASLQLGKRW
jgi:hypothetical protein